MVIMKTHDSCHDMMEATPEY